MELYRQLVPYIRETDNPLVPSTKLDLMYLEGDAMCIVVVQVAGGGGVYKACGRFI
jgi:hypothetical protein